MREEADPFEYVVKATLDCVNNHFSFTECLAVVEGNDEQTVYNTAVFCNSIGTIDILVLYLCMHKAIR